jgi:aryl-alcohol dehydrogenase-like predicted oxidoreductase
VKTKSLGPDAPPVTVVGFGGMPLSIVGRPPEDDAVNVVLAALDAGMTFLDTANVYCLDDSDLGHNERLFSRALKQWNGNSDEILVATKGGMDRPGGTWTRNGRPDFLNQCCRQSLHALGVDVIDLYQLHAPDPEVPFEESVGALARLKEEGLIKHVGISNVTVDQIKAAGEIVPITTVQNRLNPFFREAVDEGVVAYCDEVGIGFLAYSPVGGGRLNQKLPDHPAANEVGRNRGITPHQAVLAWVLAQGESVIIIPGARSVKSVQSSAAVANVSLSADDLATISSAEFSRAK